MFLQQDKGREKANKPLIFKHRPIYYMAIEEMKTVLKKVDWSCLGKLNVNMAYSEFHQILQNSIDKIAPEKAVIIHPKISPEKSG